MGAACLAVLSACTDVSLPDNRAPQVGRANDPSGQISLPDRETGACFAQDFTPAVIQTVTEHNLVQPAQIAADGSVIYPATYRTVTRQVIVQDRQEQVFEALCEADLTGPFVASLQRALEARGHYSGPINGELTPRTRRAVRAFQQHQGLDSALLSAASARQLGLISYLSRR
ncbi:hypothetical protein AIOL_002095 [Candidatus Rhodobacter oscarellae]|uniref:Peptidoglycan binding-like domain-containing protein n=1 Tax=Candidatus Rhodobacter oscarellae TaxID=1675527 RepID=A0A0J9E326_9RHOB|nr:peptidoglycan-binding domain-containing protein [Candidatus Rhodobacter lobularis]KMW57135.1 hypothetical protein AIOL_002095 [Candidatus Rhodobacter lobularis]